MTSRSHLSIGEVLSLLQEEFPDVTISKIRFLESQGLVDPERTPSGYRKFYEPDIERLRWVLRQQRDAFLPLKVIKGRLEGQADLLEGTDGQPPPPFARSFDEEPVPSGPSDSVARQGLAQPAVAASVKQPGGHFPGSHDWASLEAAREVVPVERALVPPGAGAGAPTGREPTAAPGRDTDEVGQAPDGGRPPDRHSRRRPGAESRNREERAADSTRPGSTRPDKAPPGQTRPDNGTEGSTEPDSTGPDRGGSRSASRREGVTLASPNPGGPNPGSGGTGSGATGERGRNKGGAARARDVPAGQDEEYSLEELVVETGADPATVHDLERYGLVTARVVAGTSYYNREAALIATVAAEYSHHGVEARHLRAFKAAADREAGLVQQVIMPLIRQRNPDARQAAADAIEDLCHLGGQLRSALIRRALSDLR